MRSSVRELATMKQNASDSFRTLSPDATWRHYKGWIVKIEGFDISTRDGELLVRYRHIGGNDFSPSHPQITFSRELSEWFEDVKVPKRDIAFEETDYDTVKRFVPVHSVSGYATLDEMDQQKRVATITIA